MPPDYQMRKVQVVLEHAKQDANWFQRLVKTTQPIAQILTPLVLATVGAWYTCATGRQHDYQTAVQILNQREQSELQARSAVFDKAIPALLDKKGNDPDSRILALETFLYNFHGVVNARSLLTDLEKEAEEATSLARSQKLQLIARGIANAQKQMISAAMHGAITVSCNGEPNSTFSLPIGAGEIPCTINYPSPWWQPWKDKHDIKVAVRCVGTHEQLKDGCPEYTPRVDQFSTSAQIVMQVGEGEGRGPFELTMFGSPFSDNTTIDHGHRIAVLLRAVAPPQLPGQVKLEVVVFPEDLVPPGYQPTLTSISRLLGGESG